MKSKIRKFQVGSIILIIGVFFSSQSFSQQIIFADDAGENITLGSEEHVSIVDNPLKDGVNGSSKVLLSNGAAWSGYTVNCEISIDETTNQLYISFYNPNAFTENQVQLNFLTPNQQWLSEAFPVEAQNGWFERVIDLTEFQGNTLTWMWIAPAAGEEGEVYFDNIYMADAPKNEIKMPFIVSETGILFLDEAGEGVGLGTEEHVKLTDNPLKDDVNDSDISLESDAQASWSGYTITCNVPITEAKSYLYVSLYNPENALENQIQINFTTPNQQWLTEEYPDEATTGWYTRVIDLTSFIGDTLNWMWLAPTAGQSVLSYMDNIYVGEKPTSNTSVERLLPSDNHVYYSDGNLKFKNLNLEDAIISIYNTSGKIVQKGLVNGSEFLVDPSIAKGIYMVKVTENFKSKLQQRIYLY